MEEQQSHELALAREAMRRERTDYRFSYWTYFWWTVITLHIYSYYGLYRLIQRRTEHAARRLAFLSYLWHVLDARAEAAGKRDEVAEGMDNLSRIYATLQEYEQTHRRDPVLFLALRVGALILFIPAAWIVGAVTNVFLNEDLRFYDEWESSYFANVEWIIQRLGYPVTMPRRVKPVPHRGVVLYVLVSVVTLGLLTIYWRYAMIRDGNGHFEDDAAAEDAILTALDVRTSAAPAP